MRILWEFIEVYKPYVTVNEKDMSQTDDALNSE